MYNELFPPKLLTIITDSVHERAQKVSHLIERKQPVLKTYCADTAENLSALFISCLHSLNNQDKLDLCKTLLPKDYKVFKVIENEEELIKAFGKEYTKEEKEKSLENVRKAIVLETTPLWVTRVEDKEKLKQAAIALLEQWTEEDKNITGPDNEDGIEKC